MDTGEESRRAGAYSAAIGVSSRPRRLFSSHFFVGVVGARAAADEHRLAIRRSNQPIRLGGEAGRSHRMQLGGGTVVRSDGTAAHLGKISEINSNRRTTMSGAAAMVITFSPRLKAETGLKNEQRRLCAHRLMV